MTFLDSIHDCAEFVLCLDNFPNRIQGLGSGGGDTEVTQL